MNDMSVIMIIHPLSSQASKWNFLAGNLLLASCHYHACCHSTQAALMLDSARFNLQANTDMIQHLLTFVRGSPLHLGRRGDS